MSPDLPTLAAVMADSSTSHWLLTSLRSALARDPVDAANDASVLSALLNRRADEVLGQALSTPGTFHVPGVDS